MFFFCFPFCKIIVKIYAQAFYCQIFQVLFHFNFFSSQYLIYIRFISLTMYWSSEISAKNSTKMPNKQCCICNSLLIFSYTPLCYRFCICLFVCIFQIVYATNAVSEIFASENCFTSFLYFSVRFLISFFILRVSTILFAFFCLFLPFFFTFTIFYSVLYLVYLLFVLYIFKKKKN